MAESASGGQDLIMPVGPFRSNPDRALATAAHRMQRAGGTLQGHAGCPDEVSSHATTLAHVQEPFASLPPETRAVRWHVKSTAQRLRDSQVACANSDLPRGELRPFCTTRESQRRVTSPQTARKRPAADDAKWS